MGERAGDPETQVLGSVGVTGACLFCGELDEAECAAAPYESLAPADPAWVSEFGGIRPHAVMSTFQAMIAAERGRFDEALRLQERAGRAARLSEDARTQWAAAAASVPFTGAVTQT